MRKLGTFIAVCLFSVPVLAQWVSDTVTPVAASGGSAGGLTGTLTSPRVPYAAGASALTDTANLAWNNTNGSLYLGGTDPADAEWSLYATKSGSNRWYNRAAGTGGVSDITGINITNSAYWALRANGSAATGTTLGIANAGMSGFTLAPTSAKSSYISFGADNTNWLTLGYGSTETARFTPNGLSLGGSDLGDAEYGLYGLKSATNRWLNRATGTANVSDIMAQNVTSSTYAQLLAYGSTASGTTLNLSNNGMAGIQLRPAASKGAFISFGPDNTRWLSFGYSDTELMRLNGSGQLGIGETSPSEPLHIRKDQAAATIALVHNANASGTSQFQLYNGAVSGRLKLYGTGASSLTEVVGEGSGGVAITATAGAITLNTSGSVAALVLDAVTNAQFKGALVEIDGVTTTAPTCAADGDVGRITRYSKSAGATISMCLCTKLSSVYTLTALGTGDCT